MKNFLHFNEKTSSERNEQIDSLSMAIMTLDAERKLMIDKLDLKVNDGEEVDMERLVDEIENIEEKIEQVDLEKANLEAEIANYENPNMVMKAI